MLAVAVRCVTESFQKLNSYDRVVVMRKPKRDEFDRGSKEYRTFIQIFLMVIILFLFLGLYMPLKPVSHLPLPESLSFIVAQRDLNQFIHPNNDTNIILPSSQCNGSVFVVIVVCSAVPNFEARQAIRNTWASYAANLNSMRVFFLLGKSHNETLNAEVSEESNRYSDVIQQDFMDTYNNLTLKSVMMLKWTKQNCGHAKYLMKVDDDMFVNLPNLFRLLKCKGKSEILIGCLIEGATPVKDWTSKWYVPDIVFSERTYPPYLSGTGYVLGRDAVSQLYRAALSTPFFYLEDIFITGVCAKKAGLRPTNDVGFKFYKRKNDVCAFKSLITAHKMTPSELHQMWKSVKSPSIKCKS